MSNKLVRILLAVAFTSFLSLGSHSLFAAEYPFIEKLKQCEAAFKESRNKSVTQEEGAKAREKHIRLTMEILKKLNTQNIDASDQGRPLTPEELSINVRVMGHLIQMLAVDQLEPEGDWFDLYL